jgi:hypothetical protein
MKKKLNLILIGLCIALASHAQRPLRWEASAVQTAQVTFDCTRGETLTFTPYIKAYGTTLTNYTASLQWQTNGMGTAFWSTNALVFTPSMDVGANRYRFWIRAESSNGVMYSAQGTINMLHGPGATVNALPLPVPVIDFATVATTNAPWLLIETDPGIPAAIDTAVAVSGTNAQAMADAARASAIIFSRTNPVTRLTGTENEWVQLDNGTAVTYRVSYPINGLKVEGVGTPTLDGMSPPLNVYYTPLAGSRQIDMGGGFWCGLMDFSMVIGWLGDEYNIDGWSGGPFAPTTLEPLYPSATGYWAVTLVNVYSVTNKYVMATTDMQLGISGLQATNIVDAVKELHVDSYTNIIWRTVWSNGWMWVVAHTNTPAN